MTELSPTARSAVRSGRRGRPSQGTSRSWQGRGAANGRPPAICCDPPLGVLSAVLVVRVEGHSHLILFCLFWGGGRTKSARDGRRQVPC